MSRKGFTPLTLIVIIAVAAIVIAGVLCFGARRQASFDGGTGVGTACPTDAMRCPDGSYVGRVGPHCEFGVCAEPSSTAPMDEPSSTTTTTTTTTTSTTATSSAARGTGAFCGGIAAGAFQCSTGYTCVASGTYPDAGGTCQIEKVTPPPGTMCADHVVTAKNTATGEIHDFPTPCQVPEGWVAGGNLPTTRKLTDSADTFSIEVPNTWNLQVSENLNPDPYTLESVSFSLPNATSRLFSIVVYTPSQWQELMAAGEGIPIVLLASSSRYYFSWLGPETLYDIDNLTTDQISTGVSEIKDSFKIK